MGTVLACARLRALAAVAAAVSWAAAPLAVWAQGAAPAASEAPRSAITYSAWQKAEAEKAEARAKAEAAAAAAKASTEVTEAPALKALRPAEPPRHALPPAQAPDLAPHAKAVHEDAQVRIEESRQRGQVREVQVKSKLPHVPSYEIQVGGKGRDPSQDSGSRGKRAWSLFDF